MNYLVNMRLLVCLLLLLAPAQVYALGPQGVEHTLHNLAYQDSANQFSAAAPAALGTDEICIFCHTPHNSNGEMPLWNRYSTNTGKTFLMYTSSASLTSEVKSNTGLDLGSSSRLCLTCHDGTTAMNALVNTGAIIGGDRPEMTSDISFDSSGVYGDVAVGDNWGPNLGTNLTNMHPINFSYAIAQTQDSGGLKTPALVKNDLKLFGADDYLECATCHDPHVNYGWVGVETGLGDIKYRPFLRRSNNSSLLCLTCHIK